MAVSGGCLCGRVTFDTTAPLGPATACHCRQCRKITGSYSIAAPVPAEALTLRGGLRWYASSNDARRGFCPECGSYLFWDEGDGAIWISLGAIDGATGTRVANHIFWADKGDYEDITDRLPHHAQGWSSEDLGKDGD